MCAKSDKPKFRIFDNRMNPDESYVECCTCGAKCSMDEDVELIVRAPRKPSDMVNDA